MTRRRATSRRGGRPPASAKWWSSDAPPWELWPDASIRLEAVEGPDGRLLSPCGRYYFDAAAADRVVGFFRDCLFHHKGPLAKKPFNPLPWQQDLLLRPVFGWKRVEDGLRRFRVVFLLVPKKNGKSMLASGLGLYLLGPDGEPGPEVYAVAKDRPQAGVVFGESAALTKASRPLMNRYDVWKTSIHHKAAGGTFKVLDGRAAGNHGWNIHGLLFDEFHEQEDALLYDVLRFGSLARAQPLHFFISTAGTDLETPCGAEYEKAKDVIAGKERDERFLPIVFEAPKDMDWTLEETWRRANPSLGQTIPVAEMRAECEEAKKRPSKRNAFLQLLLNRWGETRESWIPPEAWEACRAITEPTDLAQLVCCAGVDLSSTTDLTCVALVYRRPTTRAPRTVDVTVVSDPDEPPPPATLAMDFELYVRFWFWIPKDTMKERIERDRVPYDRWVRDGWVRTCSGRRVDYAAVRRAIQIEMKKKHPHLKEVAVDPWNATDFNTQLLERGVPVVEVRQGYQTLSAPSKLLEALVMDGMLRHDGNPCAAWCVGNTQIGRDANENIRPLKPKVRHRRIDGLAALITGLSRLMVQPEKAARGGHIAAV